MKHDWQETDESNGWFGDYVCLQCGVQKLASLYSDRAYYYDRRGNNETTTEPECN